MKGALVARRRRWLAERLCANAGRGPRRDVRPQGGTRPGSTRFRAQRLRSCRPVTSCKSMKRFCSYSCVLHRDEATRAPQRISVFPIFAEAANLSLLGSVIPTWPRFGGALCWRDVSERIAAKVREIAQ